jgi:transcription elongation GreA/GreB family factor
MARAAADRATVARVERDLRYWSSRRSTAEVVDPVVHPETVRFGCTVELQTADGSRIRFKIVGEDESDPAHGRISYVSPLAAAMIGAAVGDEIEFRGGMAEITLIE